MRCMASRRMTRRCASERRVHGRETVGLDGSRHAHVGMGAYAMVVRWGYLG
mgnify:CR=1 FL=1